MNLVLKASRNIVQEFIANITSENTKVAYSRDLSEFFDFYNGLFSHPSDLTVGHFIAYRDSLIRRGLSSSSVQRKLAATKSLMSWCVVQGLIPFNPVDSLKYPKRVIKDETIAFTDLEASKLMESPDEKSFNGNNHKLMLKFLFTLGLRRSELVNIKLSDIYFQREVRVIKILGKGDKVRTIPLTKALSNAVDQYLENFVNLTGSTLKSSDYLFQSYPNRKNEKPINSNTVFKVLQKYVQELGIDKRVSPHSCRATVISHLLEKEVSPRDVAMFAGHASIQTTVDVYDKKRDQIKNSAVYKVIYE